MNQISPFRLTPDDLEGLDKKTRDGLGPLLDALNVFCQQVTQFSAGVTAPISTTGTFSTDAGGSAYVVIKSQTTTQPVSVVVDQVRLVDSTDDLGAVYSFSWQLIGANIRGLFQGLAASTKYAFTVSYR